MKADQAAGVFPLKARDEAISWGFALFKVRLLPVSVSFMSLSCVHLRCHHLSQEQPHCDYLCSL